ncbi:hypothetical protein IWW50_002031 [Coemansia erecta]|nr:hypothetical protein IWW50_002031 [Coemansia erecta]
MKLSAAISSIIALAAATEYTIPVTNDVGLVYTNMNCGTTPCSQTNIFGQPTYTAFLGNRDYRRILMSFSLADVDPSSITSCTLKLPPTEDTSYTLSVSPVMAAYDARTVTPVTAPMTGSPIAQAAAPSELDVTSACKEAADGTVKLALDARGGPVTYLSGVATLVVNA